MNNTALENQKNTIEYYIDELNKIYKSLDYEEKMLQLEMVS